MDKELKEKLLIHLINLKEDYLKEYKKNNENYLLKEIYFLDKIIKEIEND